MHETPQLTPAASLPARTTRPSVPTSPTATARTEAGSACTPVRLRARASAPAHPEPRRRQLDVPRWYAHARTNGTTAGQTDDAAAFDPDHIEELLDVERPSRRCASYRCVVDNARARSFDTDEPHSVFARDVRRIRGHLSACARRAVEPQHHAASGGRPTRRTRGAGRRRSRRRRRDREGCEASSSRMARCRGRCPYRHPLQQARPPTVGSSPSLGRRIPSGTSRPNLCR